MFIEVGIFGFILFAAVLICLFQSGFTLAKRGEDRTVRLIGCGALCGTLASLVQGMTDYVWYNYRVYFVFFALMGIGVAARRCGDYARARDEFPSSVSPTGADLDFVPTIALDSADTNEITSDNAEKAVE